MDLLTAQNALTCENAQSAWSLLRSYPQAIYLRNRGAVTRRKGFPVRTNNSGQLERTLKELRRLGRIENVDAAAVQALRSMARALDDNPQHAALWRQYREALRELTADDDHGSVDEALAGLFAEVRDEAPS